MAKQRHQACNFHPIEMYFAQLPWPDTIALHLRGLLVTSRYFHKHYIPKRMPRNMHWVPSEWLWWHCGIELLKTQKRNQNSSKILTIFCLSKKASNLFYLFLCLSRERERARLLRRTVVRFLFHWNYFNAGNLLKLSKCKHFIKTF